MDARQIDPVDLRRAIGHVPQDPMLFYGSLKHNLLVGAPFADEPICCMRHALPVWMSLWPAIPRATTCWWRAR
jgi:ABC-type multidrug transport system fused ATPase/permease subunit